MMQSAFPYKLSPQKGGNTSFAVLEQSKNYIKIDTPEKSLEDSNGQLKEKSSPILPLRVCKQASEVSEAGNLQEPS